VRDVDGVEMGMGVVMWMVGREVAQRVNVKGVSKVFP
jgi:hypothetical protein